MTRTRILVADDEEGIRESLKLILDGAHDVTFAADGQESLKQLTTGAFDLALLDIKMPKLDGIEVMKELKKRKVATPVLVLTAYQSVELAKEAVKLGAVDYLPKPFNREQVLGAIHSVLAKK